MRFLKKYSFTFLMVSMSYLVNAQEIEVSISKSINWEESIITLDITALAEDAWTAPSSRYNLDKLISKRAPVLAAESISEIALTSLDTVGSAILKNTSLYGDLLKLPDLVGKTFSTASEDRKSLTVRYNIPIFPHVANLFIHRNSADAIDIDLRYSATTEFTGILIYAGEKLPLLGTNKKTLVKPAIFPKIYDKELNILIDTSKVEPEFLKKWGTVAYSINENKEYYGNRLGAFPMRTMASAIFGKNETDLILTENAVRKIISNESNRRLLSQGRVLIIYSDGN